MIWSNQCPSLNIQASCRSIVIILRPPREVWDPREQEHPAPWAWLFQDPDAPELRGPKWLKDASDIAWILTGIALPLSSAQVPLTHGAPWEDHAEKEVQSIDTYDGKQIVPQLGKSETRPKHRQSASCISLTAMVHPHRLPSRFYKKGTHQNKSATSELKLSFWRSEISDIYLIYIWVCVYDFVSDCLCKIKVGSTPRRWMDDSALLASVLRRPAWMKELQAVCLWSL